jgi:hypothetical protein
MTSLPTLVSSLNNFNAQVSSLQTTALHNVFVGMNATKDAVAAMYSTQYINTTLNAMLDDFDGLNLAPVRASLVALNSGLGTLDYDTVRNHLLQIKVSDCLTRGRYEQQHYPHCGGRRMFPRSFRACLMRLKKCWP